MLLLRLPSALRTEAVIAAKSTTSPVLWKSFSTSSSNTPFTYRMGAAACPKNRNPRDLKADRDYWNYGSGHAASPPYIRSVKQHSGEDAFFMSTIGGSKRHVAFGLADGVGGWQDQGVDPSDFSHGLCGYMAGQAYEHTGEPDSLRSQQVLQTAYDTIISNPRIVAGGSTASLATLNAQGHMEAVNLGDSGYIVLRPGLVAERSKPQTHAFNTPYQLAKIPPKMQAQHAIFGGAQHFSETPKQADVTHHDLRHGDIVIFATDGVWDNLSAMDTLGIVQMLMEERKYWTQNKASSELIADASLFRAISETVKPNDQADYLPGLIASAVMREAKLASMDMKRDGPFAKEVKKYYPGEDWHGGKVDDIAVVVCVAVQEEGAIKAKL